MNAAGLCRLKIHGTAGQKIVLQFGETLDRNGNLDLRGMSFLPRALNHRDIYICRGGEEEIYMPSFTYHGFQYALVIGMTYGQATPDALTYVVMNSDLHERGGFTVRIPFVNALAKGARVSDPEFITPDGLPAPRKERLDGGRTLSCEHVLLI